MNACKRNMNTFAFVGDLANHPEVSCVYHSEEAENQFLKGKCHTHLALSCTIDVTLTKYPVLQILGELCWGTGIRTHHLRLNINMRLTRESSRYVDRRFPAKPSRQARSCRSAVSVEKRPSAGHSE